MILKITASIYLDAPEGADPDQIASAVLRQSLPTVEDI